MAGVSSKEIKNRIRSMESTKQITKAMEMVAASKLRKAQSQVQRSRPYFEILYSTINEIVASNSDFSSEYLVHNHFKYIAVIATCQASVAGNDHITTLFHRSLHQVFRGEI